MDFLLASNVFDIDLFFKKLLFIIFIIIATYMAGKF